MPGAGHKGGISGLGPASRDSGSPPNGGIGYLSPGNIIGPPNIDRGDEAGGWLETMVARD